MRVSRPVAREFHEREAIECGWSKTQLERQIQTSYYERIIAHHGEEGLLTTNHERLAGEKLTPIDVLKSPMVLEFLNLPDDPNLHESKQIFASKYLKFLPTEEELRLEIEKERRLIEANLADRKGLLSFDENSVPNAERTSKLKGNRSL